MAPIRRYLRISQYSALEVRIYLDNPSLASSWLLNPRHPVLPRVIEAVRPLVLPKLREETERDRSRGRLKAKKKGVKDVVVEEDFEVSIFLTPTTTSHSLLTKQKTFRDINKKGMQSNSSKLTGAGTTSDAAIEVEDVSDMPITREEEGSEDGYFTTLQDIPSAPGSDDEEISIRRSKRRRSDADGLFVEDDEDNPPSKRARSTEDGEDDKKKLGMDVSYDGFSIYGRVLCLIVKRKESSKDKDKGKGKAGYGGGGGQAMMEDWIASTQMPAGEEEGP